MRDMNHYKLVQRCRPEGADRLPELLEFFEGSVELLGITSFDVPEFDQIVETPSHDFLVSVLKRARQKAIAPSVGVDFDIHGSIGNTGCFVRFEVHCCTYPDEIFIDFINIDFGREGPEPTRELLERGICIFSPFEAYISELGNEHSMDAYSRQRKISGFSRPAVVRWLHYLDRDLANSVGGIPHCVRAPMAFAQEIHRGVLIQLTAEPFDSENSKHLAIQRMAMDYLGIE
jgi:hypothetical protein